MKNIMSNALKETVYNFLGIDMPLTAEEEMTALEEQHYKWGADNLPE